MITSSIDLRDLPTVVFSTPVCWIGDRTNMTAEELAFSMDRAKSAASLMSSEPERQKRVHVLV